MRKPKEKRSGRFDFEVEKGSVGTTHRGELDYTVTPEGSCTSRVSVYIEIQDEELNYVNESSGVWTIVPIGPIEIDLSSRDIKKLEESGTIQQKLLDKFVDEAMQRSDDKKFSDFINVYYGKSAKFTSIRKKLGIDKNPWPSISSMITTTLDRFWYGPPRSYHSFMNQENEESLDPQVKEHSRSGFRRIILISVFGAVICILLANADAFEFLRHILLIFLWTCIAVTWWANMEERTIDGVSNDDYDYSFSSHWRRNLYKLGIYLVFALVVSTGNGLQIGTSVGGVQFGFGS